MDSKRLNNKNNLILLIDICCIIYSYLFVTYIRFGAIGHKFFSTLYGSTLIELILIYIGLFELTNINRINIFKRGFFDEFIGVVKNQFYLLAFIMLYLYITQEGGNYSRLLLVVFFVINTLLTYVARCYTKVFMLLGYKRSESSNKIMLITIANKAEDIIRKIRSEYEWEIQFTSICVIDRNMVGDTILGIPVIADHSSMLDEAKLNVTDEVFIDLPYRYKVKLEEMILEFEKMGIVVHLNIDIYNNMHLQEKTIESLGGYQVITFRTNMFDIKQLFIKRLLDIIGGFVGVILTGILTIFIAPAILIESRGPVFFSQIRVGKNGRRFKIYKFRSMYRDAEEQKKHLMKYNEVKGLMFKMTDDPRITKVGKFLRKTSLDEFPQFLNVLKGDMSLVGTRPPTVDEFEKYETFHRRRISIKPGLTGMWQVSGRSDIDDFDEVVRLDLYYIDHWSVGLDIKLLVKTVLVVVVGRGSR